MQNYVRDIEVFVESLYWKKGAFDFLDFIEDSAERDERDNITLNMILTILSGIKNIKLSEETWVE